MDISVISNREPEPLDLAVFERLAAFVLTSEGAPETIELSVALVDIEEMTALNGEYRGKDGPTDVLSFDMDDPFGVYPEGEPIAIGDVVIAPDIAVAQALEYGHTAEEELDLLLVHGVLHLLGYDHEVDEDAEAMQEQERRLLAAWRALG